MTQNQDKKTLAFHLAASIRPIRLPFVVFVGLRDGLIGSERFGYDLNELLSPIGQPTWNVPSMSAHSNARVDQAAFEKS